MTYLDLACELLVHDDEENHYCFHFKSNPPSKHPAVCVYNERVV